MPDGVELLGLDEGVVPLLQDSALERIEIELLLEGIYRQYGYDFREYALGSLRRRLWRRAHAEGVRTLSALQERVLHDPACMDRLLADLSVNVTALFRDPTFFRAFRQKAVPLLRTYPFIRVWTAGCASGEEAYSMAILLREEGLYERARIYATDTNEGVVRRARQGRFAADRLGEYGMNHERAGGVRPLTDYVRVADGTAEFVPELFEHIVFAAHDLVTDRSFNEFHAILCRNVMIYFSRPLQDDVHRLFYDSLVRFGVLALGRRESVRFTPHEGAYEALDASEKLYRKVA